MAELGRSFWLRIPFAYRLWQKWLIKVRNFMTAYLKNSFRPQPVDFIEMHWADGQTKWGQTSTVLSFTWHYWLKLKAWKNEIFIYSCWDPFIRHRASKCGSFLAAWVVVNTRGNFLYIEFERLHTFKPT